MDVVRCNRCNRERPPREHPCPSCHCPEYRIVPAGTVEPCDVEYARRFVRRQRRPYSDLPGQLLLPFEEAEV